MADTVRREWVESLTFGRGWLVWPGPSDGMRFTFEGETGKESASTNQVCFTMDVERGVITSGSPKQHQGHFVRADADRLAWFTLVTNDGEVFGFRWLTTSGTIAAAE